MNDFSFSFLGDFFIKLLLSYKGNRGGGARSSESHISSSYLPYQLFGVYLIQEEAALPPVRVWLLGEIVSTDLG
jgi:hypothetical protein